ncbi:MAG TPA: glyoxalase superfamily protein [Xanthobacteraceae bacterium]|nr:glyoxalase superfamily protein [Xanthobacteraceae bacterium]
MRSFRNAKDMAKALRAALAAEGTEIAHARALEIVAAQFGCADWNTLAAAIAREEATGTDAGAAFTQVIPIFRIFDEDKAREFYVGFLGFALDWEHRFGTNFPLYAQVSRAGLSLHLSGHHGDASPGSTAFVEMAGIRAFQRELAAKDYKHMKPGVQNEPWGLVMEVIDPFGNRIRFCERHSG